MMMEIAVSSIYGRPILNWMIDVFNISLAISPFAMHKTKDGIPVFSLAPQTANCNCSSALRYRQSGRAAYKPDRGHVRPAHTGL